MLMTEDVQYAVDDEPGQFPAHRLALCTRMLGGALGADVDVADDGIGRRCSRESERDHISRSGVIEMRLVEPGNRAPVDKCDGHERVAYLLGLEDALRDLGDARLAERRPDVVCRDVDVQAHTEANSDVTPPLAAG